MGEDTFWNGERCVAAKGTAVVVDSGQFPEYWARHLVGVRIPVVLVTYAKQGQFVLDNRGGHGWRKITDGRGSPRCPHRNVDIDQSTFRFEAQDA